MKADGIGRPQVERGQLPVQKPFSLSVKAVVRDADGRCLLLKRSAANQANAGKWDLPGGKLDPGERVDQALCREVAEETGLTISVRRVAAAAQSELRDRTVVYLILEAQLESGQVHLSEEHDDSAWVTLSELPQMDLAGPFRSFARSYCKSNS
jgi:8-oxo-dGTP diphosphatase